MDFRRVEIFVEVVKRGTFSHAAEHLFLTQPTVSAHMANLENEVGSPLFERRGKKIVLTSAGEEFYPFAQDIISLKEKALEQMEKYKKEAKGKIDIVTSSTPGNYLLPLVLRDFNRIFPDTTFSLTITHSNKARKMVSSYECDLGISGEGELMKGLEQFLIYQDRMVGIVSRGHKWEGKIIEIKDLKENLLVMPKFGSATREIFREGLSSQGYEIGDFNCFLETNSLEGIKNHVREGLGAGLISSIAVNPDEGLGTFHINGLDLFRNFYVIYNNRRVFPSRVERFLAFLRERRLKSDK